MGTRRRALSGFSLIELLVVVAIIAVLIGILLPALGDARRSAKSAVCEGNVRQYATATGSYASERKDRLPAMDWRRGSLPPADLPGQDFEQRANTQFYFATDLEAASYQVVYIIRKKTGMNNDKAPVPVNWIPYILYTHIPLNDYIGGNLPSPIAVCPEDAWRREVQRHWENPQSTGLPYPADGGDGTMSNWRWPFSTSYSIHQAHWGPSRARRVQNPEDGLMSIQAIWYPEDNVLNGLGGNYYTTDGNSRLPGQFGVNKYTDVRFPSQKVIMSDEWGRHSGRRPILYAAPESRQPLGFYDGSVRVLRTAEVNPGWDPTNGSSRKNMAKRLRYVKEQQTFDPKLNPISVTIPATSATVERNQYRVCAGWFKYTRGGLYGWDVPRGVGDKGLRATIQGTGLNQTMNTGIIESELDTSVGDW